eukprot:gene15926-17527_t
MGMKQGKEETMAKNWDGFAHTSSVHGLRYTSPDFNKTRRIAWTLFIATGLMILIGMTVQVVWEYYRYEVNTVVKMVSDKEVNFPAVTICNMNTMQKSKFTKVGKDPKYKQLLQLARILAMADISTASSNMQFPSFTGKDIKDIYKIFGHTMDQFEQGGMLLNCTYRNEVCNKSVFLPVLTHLGQCYTFNSGKDSNDSDKSIEILKVSHPGSSFGLKLRMTVQASDYLLLPTQGFSTGWKMYIHDQGDLPLADIYGFSLSPGTHTLVSLKKTRIMNLEPPYTTACRKEPLVNGQRYSRKACLRICQDRYIEETCGCQMPINFQRGDDSKLCNLENSIKCALPAINAFKQRGTCTCPEPCQSTSYSELLSYAYFPSDAYAEEVAKHLVNHNFTSSIESAMVYMRKNIIELDIFYEQMNHLEVKQIPAKTLHNIYSELGGLLGASLGASFLTFIELFDFIYTRLAARYEKRRERLIKVKAYVEEEKQVKELPKP